MKKIAMALSTLIIILIVCAIALEGAYRVYLNSKLDLVIAANTAQVASEIQAADDKTFKVYGAPGPWVYVEQYGFDFADGPWIQASIVNGHLAGCSNPNGGNRFGNVGLRNPNYEVAEFKVHIYGSSFTMGSLQDGSSFADGLEQVLSSALDKSVSVLNFSRDSIGLQTNFDTAGIKVPELKPDLVLFVENYSAFFFGRHWRSLEPLDDDTGRLVFLSKPLVDIGPDDQRVGAVRLVSKLIDQEWCDRVVVSPTDADSAAIDRIAELNRMLVMETRKRPIPINFLSLERSFVFNRIVNGNAFQGVDIFTDNEPMNTIDIDDFGDDERLVSAMQVLKNSGAAYAFLNIPTLQGMRTPPEGRFHFGLQKVDEMRGQSLAKSLERLSGQKFYHLYDWYPDAKKSDPLSLVVSEQDSHPSAKGNRVLINAIVDALKDMPSTRHLFE